MMVSSIPTLGTLGGRSFSAVIVDNDMTLVNSSEGIDLSWRVWAENYQVDPAKFHSMVGRSAAGIVAELIPDIKLHEEANNLINNLELEYAYTTRALPGSARLLAALPPERIAVASSGIHAIIYARLAAAGLKRPCVVVGAEDVRHAKPAPDIFLVAVERLGFLPEQCLVVEDSLNGLAAAHSAGCATLALTTSHEVSQITADAIVRNLGDVTWRVDDAGIQVSLMAG